MSVLTTRQEAARTPDSMPKIRLMRSYRYYRFASKPSRANSGNLTAILVLIEGLASAAASIKPLDKMPLIHLPLEVIAEIIHIYIRDFIMDDDVPSVPRHGFKALKLLLRVSYGLAILVAEDLLVYRRTFRQISGSRYPLDRSAFWVEELEWSSKKNAGEINMLEASAIEFLSLKASTACNFGPISERFRQIWSEVVACRTSPLSGFHFQVDFPEEVSFDWGSTSMSMVTPFLKRNKTRML